MNRENENLGLLKAGKYNEYPTTYSPGILEVFKNKHIENDYMVSLKCAEFTSLCPITNQPDFAKIIINYIPDINMVESKSLKLYLFSFRNHGDFHEDCINIIMKDLQKILLPRYIEVLGLFTPRGGISINPFSNYGNDKFKEIAQKRLFEINSQFS